jgi:aspartyl-tRNA(Asn)/glutamyl-tRNA(Gln) amidotransferase subunit A
VVGTVIGAEAASAFRDLIDSGRARELRTANLRSDIYAAAMTLAVDYLDAMRVRAKIKRALDELYAKYDALVAPSRGTVSYPIAVDFHRAYPGLGGGPAIIPAGNLAGQPAVSVPNGFGENNLPTGIQFTGRAWGEARLLTLAHAYQQATDWHRRRPPAP